MAFVLIWICCTMSCFHLWLSHLDNSIALKYQKAIRSLSEVLTFWNVIYHNLKENYFYNWQFFLLFWLVWVVNSIESTWLLTNRFFDRLTDQFTCNVFKLRSLALVSLHQFFSSGFIWVTNSSNSSKRNITVSVLLFYWMPLSIVNCSWLYNFLLIEFKMVLSGYFCLIKEHFVLDISSRLFSKGINTKTIIVCLAFREAVLLTIYS